MAKVKVWRASEIIMTFPRLIVAEDRAGKLFWQIVEDATTNELRITLDGGKTWGTLNDAEIGLFNGEKIAEYDEETEGSTR